MENITEEDQEDFEVVDDSVDVMSLSPSPIPEDYNPEDAVLGILPNQNHTRKSPSPIR